MNVAIVHTDFRLYWKPRLEAFHRYCKERGWRLFIVEIAGKGSLYSFAGDSKPDTDLQWHILFPHDPMEDLSIHAASNAVWKKLDELNPDVVVAGAIAFPCGATSVGWARRNRKAIVIFDDARDVDTPRNFFIQYVKRLVYKNVDTVLCPAPSHLPTYLGFGFHPERVFYGVNAIDNDYYLGRTAEARSLYKSERPFERKFLLAIGRQVPKKNFERLVDAFIAYLKLYPQSKLNLVLIGEGPEHTTLFDKVSKNFVSGVSFLPFLNQETLITYYATAEGLILPSLYGETWGLVVNEAMASGLPAFVSNQCGCAETLVHEGVNGWKFDPLDTADIFRIIKSIDELEHSSREQMGINSAEIIKEWGLERFCDGAFSAMDYAFRNTKHKKGMLTGLVVRLWKGRYRPT